VLRNKKILLGVSGSIAAYKTASLIRLLKKEEAEVRVIMTPSASDFITPLTLSTLSENPVLTEFIKYESGQWNNHVDLGLWADLMVIAPASANTMGKLANGICDNLLTAVYLSVRCPVWLAPAMDLDMYEHPSVVENMKKLRAYGNLIIDAEYGELASRLTGKGRMAEPETIFARIRNFFSENLPLSGKKVLITAGPTYEPIDPVRFIGNHSSGKMGFQLAETFRDLGAKVSLISGPTSLSDPAGIETFRVKTASEMFEKASEKFSVSDIAILAAAVADYRPENAADSKIKKNGESIDLMLKKTVDIASELGKRKTKAQIVVGFALETENELENARKKLKDKNFDMVVLNSLKDEGAGFAYDTNKVTIITKDNKIIPFELKNKKEVAADIARTLLEIIHA
jgi:phosphopantothenoylcysteine decarboxylase/phosphopantothenate--cysteine ligase